MPILVALSFIAIFAMLTFLTASVLPYCGWLGYAAITISVVGLLGSLLGLFQVMRERGR